MKENTQIHSMEEDEYAKMAELDESMWWYRALHRLIWLLLRRFLPKGAVSLLDAGCGTGGLLRFISRKMPDLRLHGVELYEPAARIASVRTGCPVSCGSVNQLPFEENRFDAVVCTNVLEQNGVDPGRAVSEVFRCLRPGGVFILSESANEWLKSYHDRRVGVARRFAKRELAAILRQAGFKIRFCSCWNTLLFPLVILRRKVCCSWESESDVKPYSRILTLFFNAVMAVERVWLRAGGSFPCGVSVVITGEKPI